MLYSTVSFPILPLSYHKGKGGEEQKGKKRKNGKRKLKKTIWYIIKSILVFYFSPTSLKMSFFLDLWVVSPNKQISQKAHLQYSRPSDPFLIDLAKRCYGMEKPIVDRKSHERGKPQIVESGKKIHPPLFTSISHSDKWSFFAFCSNDVGLDAEWINPDKLLPTSALSNAMSNSNQSSGTLSNSGQPLNSSSSANELSNSSLNLEHPSNSDHSSNSRHLSNSGTPSNNKPPKKIDIMAIAKMYFSKQEVKILENQKEHERMATFFQWWTTKEAYVKSAGLKLLTGIKTCASNIPPQWTWQVFLFDRENLEKLCKMQSRPAKQSDEKPAVAEKLALTIMWESKKNQTENIKINFY